MGLKMDREFPDDRYDEKGIYIPRLYGRPWQEWYQLFGLKNKEEIKAYVEEQGVFPEGKMEWRHR